MKSTVISHLHWEGYSTKFYMWRLNPEVQPLTFYIPFSTEKILLSKSHYGSCSFLYLLTGQMVPLSHTSLERSTVMTDFPTPFIYTFNQPVISLPFHMPEPRKRYLFLAAPPFIIHYREYPGIFTL